MEDVIKSINISAIDILGMILPGCAFILVMNEGGALESLIAPYFTFKSASAWIFLLLIAGYIVGMLFHTVSDLAERMLWECYLVDPKFYAAYKVSGRLRGDSISTQVGSSLEQSDNTPTQVSNASAQRANPPLQGGIPGVRGVIHHGFWHVWRGIKFCAGFMLNASVLYVAWGGSCIQNLVGPIITSIVAVLLFFVSFRIVDYFADTTQNNRYIRFVNSIKACEDNAWIQVCVSKKKNDPKRNLFDGFRVMMRNLLWCLAFLRLSGYLQGLTRTIAMIPHGTTIYRFFLIAAVLRYMHNAYLKYKYAFEDYLYICENVDVSHTGSGNTTLLRTETI